MDGGPTCGSRRFATWKLRAAPNWSRQTMGHFKKKEAFVCQDRTDNEWSSLRRVGTKRSAESGPSCPTSRPERPRRLLFRLNQEVLFFFFLNIGGGNKTGRCLENILSQASIFKERCPGPR